MIGIWGIRVGKISHIILDFDKYIIARSKLYNNLYTSIGIQVHIIYYIISNKRLKTDFYVNRKSTVLYYITLLFLRHILYFY